MIRNIVFDIGMVLVGCRWKSLMEEKWVLPGTDWKGQPGQRCWDPIGMNSTAVRNPERRSGSSAVSTRRSY